MAIDWMAEAQALRDQMIAHRRDFHQHPELAFEEVRTAGIVAKELGALGLEVMTGIGNTGVVGILEGKSEGPTVMVRCDMDALPIEEANSTPYNSQSSGKMHACGHDGHTSIGLAVARMLTNHRDQLTGRVKFVFQPAEEIAQGAYAMIKAGVLENPKPVVALGLHLWNNLPTGQVSITEGSEMAGASIFNITVRGYGGHGALPELARDPLVASAQIVSALQTIVSRNVSALDTAVVSVCSLHAGHANNVIPNEAKMQGTYRVYRNEINDLIERRMREVVTGVATALGCEAEIDFTRLTPPLINNAESNARMRRAVQRYDSIRYLDSERTMGAEDMAIFLEQVPGTFFLVGSADSSRGLDYPHHHPRFDIDENALPIGAGLLAAAVADYLIQNAGA